MSTPHPTASFQPQPSANGRAHAPTGRLVIPGYTPTILRSDVKDALREFRRAHNYLHSEHIERCLVSAAVEMVLTDPSLLSRLFEQLDRAVAEDTRLLRSVGGSSA